MAEMTVQLKEPLSPDRLTAPPPVPPVIDHRHCAKNPKSHRHLPANLVSDRESVCRFCGETVTRAHPKSTWWFTVPVDPTKKPSKAEIRKGKKMLRKAFARKDQVGSTRADAKREALAYAERRSGRRLSWKAARKLVKRWAHEERGVG